MASDKFIEVWRDEEGKDGYSKSHPVKIRGLGTENQIFSLTDEDAKYLGCLLIESAATTRTRGNREKDAIEAHRKFVGLL